MADDFDASKYSTFNLATRVLQHVMEKGYQAGALLGTVIAIPAVAYFKKTKDPVVLTQAAAYTTYGMTALSGAAALAKFTQIDRQGFEDRAYRLHHSSSQNRTDKFCSAGAIVGAFATALYFKQLAIPFTAHTLVGGSAVGTTLGLALHMITKPESQREPNQMVNILKEEVASGR